MNIAEIDKSAGAADSTQSDAIKAFFYAYLPNKRTISMMHKIASRKRSSGNKNGITSVGLELHQSDSEKFFVVQQAVTTGADAALMRGQLVVNKTTMAI